jgi:methylmalonyl-CoA/ethylmalonyl-CoA epimerase
VALGVDDIEDRIKEIKEAGLRMIDDSSRKGAHNADVAFVHPKSTAGVLYELCEQALSKEEQK